MGMDNLERVTFPPSPRWVGWIRRIGPEGRRLCVLCLFIVVQYLDCLLFRETSACGRSALLFFSLILV